MRGLRLGAFELVAPEGSGGQGTVWTARHAASGLPCVVKLLRPDRGDATSLRAFAREVRAVARLDHPHVVSVFDHGVVSAADQRASDGAVREGSPWLAMERVSGGALTDRPDEPDEVTTRVRALLSALAHAHARGVLHLDLKPANVLVAGPGDLRPGLRVVDFGIAALDGERFPGATPAWSAPEQLRAGPVGPPTDLFAVGRLAAYWLDGRPHPLTEWADTCTAPRPEDRFPGCAAALSALPGGPGTWLGAVRPPPELPILGLALFAHRVPRLLGRATELATLAAWHRDAVAASAVVPVTLCGPVGVGRRALARAVVEASREAGIPEPGLEGPPAGGAGLALHVAGVAPERGRSLAVAPLPPEVMARAIEEWLPLRTALVASLVADARGRPGTARRRIVGWVAAGRLRPGPDGFVLVGDGDWDAPRTLPAVPAGDLVALEAVALLGPRAARLRHVLRVAQAAGSSAAAAEGVLRSAADLGLVDLDPEAVWFVDPVDRADVLDRLPAADLARLTEVAFAVVGAEVGPEHPAVAALWWRRGRPDEAVRAWLGRTGDLADEASHLEAAVALVAEGLGDADPRTLSLQVRRLELLDRLRRPELAAAAASLRAAALLAQDRRAAAAATTFLALGVRWEDPEGSIALARVALALAEDGRAAVMSGQLLAHLLAEAGRPGEAAEVVAAVRARPEPHTPEEASALAYVAGVAALASGDRAAAEQEFLAALAAPSSPAAVALATLLEEDGRADEARRLLEAACAHAPNLSRRVDARLRLASLEFARGAYGRSAAELRAVFEEGPPPGDQEVRARVMLAACAAHDRDHAGFREWFGPARALLLSDRRLHMHSLGAVIRRARWWLVDAPPELRADVDEVIDAFVRGGVSI